MAARHEEDEFDLDDLDLSGLTVTVMRGAVAIAESGASNLGSHVASCSCSCTCLQDDGPIGG